MKTIFEKIIVVLSVCLVTFTIISCTGDNEMYKFATENNVIVNGKLTGHNIHFLGTWTVITDSGETFSDEDVRVEFAGLENVSTYIYGARFEKKSIKEKIKFRTFGYSGKGKSISVNAPDSFIPQVLRKNSSSTGMSYQDVKEYKISNVKSMYINNLNCTLEFRVAGNRTIHYSGKLLEKY